jgi:hypothetical protein
LGINSPTFDSRSEVSVASRVPTPPKTPQLDPLAPIDPKDLGIVPLDINAKEKELQVVLPPEPEVEETALVSKVAATEEQQPLDVTTPTKESMKSGASPLNVVELVPLVEKLAVCLLDIVCLW